MNLFRFLLLPILLVCTLSARAEVLVGIANVSNITGLNLEWAGDHNSYYVVPGMELKGGGLDDNRFRWVVGMRHRLDRAYMSTSGFFSGLQLGNYEGVGRYDRLGAGPELGYQWVKDYTRIGLSSALLYMEAVPEADINAEPNVVLGITISLRK